MFEKPKKATTRQISCEFYLPLTKATRSVLGVLHFQIYGGVYSSEYSASIYAKNSDRHRVRDRDVQELSVRHSLLSILDRTYACSVSFKNLLLTISKRENCKLRRAIFPNCATVSVGEQRVLVK